MKKRVLVISFSDVHSDPRVFRQVHSLAKNYAVTLLHLGTRALEDINCINAGPKITTGPVYKAIAAFKLLLRRYDWFYWSQPHIKRSLSFADHGEYDLIVANDLNALRLAIKWKKKDTKLLFDAHEYSTRELEAVFWWRLVFQPNLKNLLKQCCTSIDASATVCDGLAREYRREFGIDPTVVYNAPRYCQLACKGTDPRSIRLVHHGLPIRERKIELMIEMMSYLDERFTLDLYLMNTNAAYLDSLKKLAAGNSAIRFREPMPMQDIPFQLNKHYDIGIFLLPPDNFNYEHALPNKFFEFMQARLAIAIGPSPEMAAIVRRENIGVISETFEAKSLAVALQKLDAEQIDSFKKSSDLASRNYCYENSEKKLLELVDSCLE